MSDKVFDIQERCFNYSISIVKLIEGLKLKSVYQPLIGQIFRSEVVAEKIIANSPDVIMLGHSGSTSAQPIINEITKILAAIIIKLSKKEE